MLTNKIILADDSGNELRMSSVKEFDNEVHFKNFSVKYVLSGEENYSINQKKHLVKKGEFVVGNQHTFSSILIDSPEPVKGICIDISKEKIQQIIQYQFDEFANFEEFLFGDELINNKFTKQNSSLGRVFDKLENEFNSIFETPDLVNTDLFYTIAECIVYDQSNLYNHYSKLNFSKQETNKRLFEFILSAKEFIDLNFYDKITIDQIARAANLSEYHFIRLFKSVYNLTPHQYIIQKRLQFSKILLLEKCCIKEIAYQSGFADVQSFSKAFKSFFGFTPNSYRKSN